LIERLSFGVSYYRPPSESIMPELSWKRLFPKVQINKWHFLDIFVQVDTNSNSL
jgi:hypothetical protein